MVVDFTAGFVSRQGGEKTMSQYNYFHFGEGIEKSEIPLEIPEIINISFFFTSDQLEQMEKIFQEIYRKIRAQRELKEIQKNVG